MRKKYGTGLHREILHTTLTNTSSNTLVRTHAGVKRQSDRNQVTRQVLNDGVHFHAVAHCVGMLIDRLARWKQQ